MADMIQTAPIDKQAMSERVTAKIAAMTPAEREARVEEIYAMPDDECTPETTLELLEILL